MMKRKRLAATSIRSVGELSSERANVPRRSWDSGSTSPAPKVNQARFRTFSHHQ